MTNFCENRTLWPADNNIYLQDIKFYDLLGPTYCARMFVNFCKYFLVKRQILNRSIFRIGILYMLYPIQNCVRF